MAQRQTCLLSIPSIFVILLLPVTAAAQAGAESKQPLHMTTGAANYEIHPATSAIKVDGVLDEPAWANATVIPLPFEYQPGDNATPPVKTDCLVTYDERHLYLACRAYDPQPALIRSHLMARDDMNTFVQDDHMAFLIDPFNDERRAYQFRVNPAGVQADAINSDVDGSEDWSWDAIWDSAARVESTGYVVEVAIALNQIRFQGTSGVQTWGFEAWRSYPRSVRHRISSHPVDRNRNCFICQFNKLTGIEALKPGHALELDPTLTLRRSDTRDDIPFGPMMAGPYEHKPGLSARWNITPNTTINATANPDFSQVEADVAQLDVNTRFALFYPEKRPFFLEGVDFFGTPEQVIFTRTVADPLGGAKFTSKSGANAVGVFVTEDRINNLLLPSNQASRFASTDDNVTGSVLRYRRDVGARSNIGVLYAGRESSGYHNRVFGPDATIRLSATDAIRAQFLYSDTLYPDSLFTAGNVDRRTAGGGDAYVAYQHYARDWTWTVNYNDRGRGFRADSGFIPRVDIRSATAMVQRRFWGTSNQWFTTFDVGVGVLNTHDHSGVLTDQSIGPYVQYTGPMQSTAVVEVDQVKERYAGFMYDQTKGTLNFSLKPNGALSIGVNAAFGDAIDYENARPASAIKIGPSVEYKVGAPLNIQFSHNLERLTVAGDWLYTANLSQARVVYHFGVRTFVRAILQYTSVSRDPRMFLFPVDGRTDRLFSQYLFSYRLNPQTVLLLGYSDTYQGVTFVPFTQAARTFFAKVGYAWLM